MAPIRKPLLELSRWQVNRRMRQSFNERQINAAAGENKNVKYDLPISSELESTSSEENNEPLELNIVSGHDNDDLITMIMI